MEIEIILFKNYFRDFYHKQDKKIQKKIIYVLNILRFMERIPEQFLKHLKGTDGLYEARIKLGSNIFRIICFFDKGNIVVLLNSFQKKSQKTPRHEIELAERLKREYYENK